MLMKKAILSLVLVFGVFMAYGQTGSCANGHQGNSYNNDRPYISTVAPAPKVDFKLFPNPTIDFIQVDEKTVKSGKAKKIHIFTLTAQEVKSFLLVNDGTYNISDLKAGTYLVQFRDFRDRVVTTRKIVKMNGNQLN